MKNTFFPLTLEKHLVTSDSLIILLLCKCVFWGCFQCKVSQVFLNSNICYLCNVLQNGILAAAGNPSESHHLELNRVWAGKKAWLANRMPFGGFFGMCCSQMQTPRHTTYGLVNSFLKETTPFTDGRVGKNWVCQCFFVLLFQNELKSGPFIHIQT